MGSCTPPVLALFFLSLVASGRAETGDAQAPVFRSDVSLVLAPVFVVDREGRAVPGLRAEDFEVLEDGRRAEVVSFRYVDTAARGDEQEDLRQASAARRRLLFLFDKSFTDLAGLSRSRRAAGQFVRTRLTESDLAAVATFDVNKGLRLVANFTEDRALLAHAIETLGVPSLSKISDPLGLAADLQATDITLAGPTDGDVPQALLDSIASVLVRQMRAAEREQYRTHVQTLIAGFADLAAGLRQVDGRKQVLYFSAGFDSRLFVGEEGYDRETASLSIVEGRLWEVDGQARYGDSRLRELFADAARSLARADAVVHAVDTTGLGEDTSLTRTTPIADASRGALVPGRESLNFLSAETGGRFFKDTNDLGPVLAEMLEMTSRYYVLGFQPRQEKGAGAYHKIKVKVARKGVKLSHRPGYFEREAGPGLSVLQRQFDAAQLVMTGAGPNDLDFTSLCLPFPRAGERQSLGLVLQLPKQSLRWQPGRSTAVEVYGYAVAEDGAVHDHIAQLARVDPARADPGGQAQGLSFYGTLSVPPGRYTIRLLVREAETEAAGVQFLEVTVPPYDPKVAFLLPPVVLDEPARWLRLDMGPGRAAPAAFPFQVAGEPFLPRASFEVRPGRAEKLVLIAYEPSLPGDPATDLEIRSSLRTRDGRAVAPGRLRIDRVHREAEGRRTYVFNYTPDEIEAGDYTLRIGIGEAGTIVESYALLRVRPRS
jgi:VWFA-related protein